MGIIYLWRVRLRFSPIMHGSPYGTYYFQICYDDSIEALLKFIKGWWEKRKSEQSYAVVDAALLGELEN